MILIRTLFLLLTCSSAALAIEAEVHIQLCNVWANDIVQKLDFPIEYKTREVIFLDTQDHSFYNSNAIFRLRIKNSQHSDSTLKLRPIDAKRIPSHWFNDNNFLCEWDSYVQRSALSCSLKEKIDTEIIQNISNGYMHPTTAISSDKLNLLSELNFNLSYLNQLRLFGPVRVIKRSTYNTVINGELDFEIWSYPRGETIYELSFRAAERDAQRLTYQFYSQVQNLNLQICPYPVSKTKYTLDYFRY